MFGNVIREICGAVYYTLPVGDRMIAGLEVASR
jgi:hypothetical protein